MTCVEVRTACMQPFLGAASASLHSPLSNSRTRDMQRWLVLLDLQLLAVINILVAKHHISNMATMVVRDRYASRYKAAPGREYGHPVV